MLNIKGADGLGVVSSCRGVDEEHATSDCIGMHRKSNFSPEEILDVASSFADGFDSDAYDRMAADEQRVGQYARAIQGAVLAKRVLDIGTGRDVLLARICAAAGAEHVTAVEVVPSIAAEAYAKVAAAGLDACVEVLTGHSASISLPKVDLVVHELVGSLALEEGMAAVLLDLQNRPDVVDASRPGWSIPRRVETRVSPITLTDALDAADSCASVDERVVMPWAASERLHVDRLVHIQAPAANQLLGVLQVLDCLDTEVPVEPQLVQSHQLTWVFDRPATLAGFACAPWLDLDGQHSVDAWLGGTSWLHKLASLASPVALRAGDEVVLRVEANLRNFPAEYIFSVELRRATDAALIEPLKGLARAAAAQDVMAIRQARKAAMAAGASKSEVARVYALHCGEGGGAG